MIVKDLELLGQFAREQSQDAFTELVNRHLNLVYSAALRRVRLPQLAEEVSQSVFTNLARHADKLAPDTILTAWLYQVTRHAAIDVVRREATRQAREQIALQMTDMNDSPANWAQIEPLLDEAMDSLEAPDRTALLLRYFENKSLREIGEALGASEDAAQKRVSRAVERLREYFARHKVSVGAGGLVALLSANAVTAAPIGLTTSVATGSVLAATISAPTTALLAKTIAITMTTTQKIIVATVFAGALVVGVHQGRQASNLRHQVQALQEAQQKQHTALADQVQQLERERDRALSQVAALSTPSPTQRGGTNEVLKLRGEVGRLRLEKTELASTSGLSKVTADPESRRMMREQQKMAMTMVYKDFASKAKLSTNQTEQLNDLLADYIMENVERVTVVLRDKPSIEQMRTIFSDQEARLQGAVQEVIGAEGLAQYQDYTKNLLSLITGEQFKGSMTGDAAAKTQKAKQISQIMQEEVGKALVSAGLPADYQTVPMLNFRNIASEQEGERSLQLLDGIYQQAAARMNTLLSPEELAKFDEFRNTAIKNNRGALSMNRILMAPISN